jgi:hypothetical protein
LKKKYCLKKLKRKRVWVGLLFIDLNKLKSRHGHCKLQLHNNAQWMDIKEKKKVRFWFSLKSCLFFSVFCLFSVSRSLLSRSLFLFYYFSLILDINDCCGQNAVALQKNAIALRLRCGITCDLNSRRNCGLMRLRCLPHPQCCGRIRWCGPQFKTLICASPFCRKWIHCNQVLDVLIMQSEILIIVWS